MISLFILIIHSIETLAYAVRLSRARVKLLASALSLFNVMMMGSRLLGTLLAQVLFIPGAKYIAWFTQFMI